MNSVSTFELEQRLELPDYENDFPRLVQDRQIFVFGAGALGDAVLKQLAVAGFTVRGVIDNEPRKWGTDFKGYTVSPPSSIEKNAVVIAASVYSEEIEKQLHEMGIRDVVTDFIVGNFYRASESIENVRAIEEVARFLEDEQSVHVFKKLLRMGTRPDAMFLSGIYSEQKYFIPVFGAPLENEVLIDGGAWQGNTIEKFLQWTDGRFEKILAFEANPATYQVLLRNISAMGVADRTVALNRCLYDHAGALPFAVHSSAQLSAASRIVEENNSFHRPGDTIHQVESVALDEYLAGEPVTLIKMDIEGAEIKALEGARETIRRHRPKMAICTYHRESDLWEIPLLLKSLVPEYKIRFRHHSKHNAWETVCYANV